MKCSECQEWEGIKNKKTGEISFGYCKAKGKIDEEQGDKETRHNDKTRPWHSCDIIRAKLVKEREVWSTRDNLDYAIQEIRDLGVPIPKAVEGLAEEDIFPSNTKSIKDSELGDMLFKYGALKGYVRWLLFAARQNYDSAHNARIILQGQEVRRIEIEDEKKRLKDGIEATAIAENKKLKEIYDLEQKLKSKMEGLQSLYDIYSDHWSTVSREISNRHDEIMSGLRQRNLS